MNKQKILEDYKNKEERLLVAKILDKYEFVKSRNKIQYSDFLNLREQEIAVNVLNKISYKNHYLFGGKENTERKILVVYPEKLSEEMSRKNDTSELSVIRIQLPSELENQYEHKIYLGAIIKLGLERSKVGDIFVSNLGADIIIKKEVEDFLMQNLKFLTRFQSAEISVNSISELKEVLVQKKEISFIVSSLRLDNIVSILSKTSRNKAIDFLNQERIFVNYKLETKPTKQVKVGDCITIRGKGKFEFKEIVGNTKKDRIVIKMDKYV